MSNAYSLWSRPALVVFFIYFLIHIPITILVDAQSLIPGYPKALTDVIDWYIQTFQDPMIRPPVPLWFNVRREHQATMTLILLCLSLGLDVCVLRGVHPVAVLLLCARRHREGYVMMMMMSLASTFLTPRVPSPTQATTRSESLRSSTEATSPPRWCPSLPVRCHSIVLWFLCTCSL
jgi:hypothetical protein